MYPTINKKTELEVGSKVVLTSAEDGAKFPNNKCLNRRLVQPLFDANHPKLNHSLITSNYSHILTRIIVFGNPSVKTCKLSL